MEVRMMSGRERRTQEGREDVYLGGRGFGLVERGGHGQAAHTYYRTEEEVRRRGGEKKEENRIRCEHA